MAWPFSYLDGSNRIDELFARVVSARGEVLMPKVRPSEKTGDVAFFLVFEVFAAASFERDQG